MIGVGIGQQDMEIICEFLRKPVTCITHVGLRNGGIMPEGFKALAKALKTNRCLTVLRLDDNVINNDCVEALIDAIVNHNVSLKEIHIFATANILGEINPSSKARIRYLTETRNAFLIPAAARRASLHLIAVRRNANFEDMGYLALIDKNIVKMIAAMVWATRDDPKWIEALSDVERTGMRDGRLI